MPLLDPLNLSALLSNLGILGGNSPNMPTDAFGDVQSKQAAAKALAAAMRQQTPTVPSPDQSTVGGRFSNLISSFGSPGMPTLQASSDPLAGTEAAQEGPQQSQQAPQAPSPQPVPQQQAPQAPQPGSVFTTGAPPVPVLVQPPQGAPLPQPRPAPGPPMNIAPQQQQQPQQAQPSSFLDKLGNGLNNNSNILLAMGAGLAGAPNLGAGLGRGFANAAPFAQQNQTMQALMKMPGMTPELAQLIRADPQSLSQIIPVAMGIKPWSIQKISTGFGDELVAVNPQNPKESMRISPSTFQSSSLPRLVVKDGITYQLQPNGQYLQSGGQ